MTYGIADTKSTGGVVLPEFCSTDLPLARVPLVEVAALRGSLVGALRSKNKQLNEVRLTKSANFATV